MVVTKLDRLARSLPDARAIADELTQRQVRLNLGGSVYDPTDPVGRLLFNVLAMVAEFETDLFRLRTREAMKVARAKGRLRGKQPKLNHRQEAHLVVLFDGGDHSTAELADLLASLVPPCTGRWNGSGLASARVWAQDECWLTPPAAPIRWFRSPARSPRPAESPCSLPRAA